MNEAVRSRNRVDGKMELERVTEQTLYNIQNLMELRPKFEYY